MDDLAKDIRTFTSRLKQEHTIAEISRGNGLDRLELLSNSYPFAVVMQHQNSLVPFYVCKRFFCWLGHKKNIHQYAASDFQLELGRLNNLEPCNCFYSHFSQPNPGYKRCWWKFSAANKEILEMCSISGLIKPDKAQAFILTLYYNNDISYSNSSILTKLWQGIDRTGVLEMANSLTDREWEAFEYEAMGMSEEAAARLINISKHTYHDHCKHMRSKFCNPPDALITRYYFAIRYSGKMTA